MSFSTYPPRPKPPQPAGRRWTFWLACNYLLIAALLVAGPIFCQTPLNERVLIVYNSRASESLAVAKYYMAQRKIPENHKCKVSLEPQDMITREDFDSHVKMPIRKCLDLLGKQKILYIVFTYGNPYVLALENRSYALDQFVADIWDEYSSSPPGNAKGPHPYFGGAQSQGNAYEAFISLSRYRDGPQALNIYSVWRLDAANANLAKGLVDKALQAENTGLSGRACFDRQSGKIATLPDTQAASGDWDIHQSAEFAERAGFAVTEDEQQAEFGTSPAPLRCDGAALYAGWYSLNHYNDAFTWNPGAIGIHLDSASATNLRGGTNWCANAVIKGITVTAGAVAEPYLMGLPHPDQIFFYLFQGANVGDAFLRSTQWLKWMILNIGDPLYRPFPRGAAPFNLPNHAESYLALLPQSLVGGTPSSGVAGLGRPAPKGGATVQLQCDHPDVVSVPSSITVRDNAINERFPIITRTVTSEVIVRISMTAGEVNRSNTLVLYPNRAHP